MRFSKYAATIPALALAFSLGTTHDAHASSVNSFAPGSSWTAGPVTSGGTAEIVDLAGTGGNLENNAPDSNGAAKITTADDNASRGEAGTLADFGQVSDIFDSDLSFSYSWYSDGANTAPAAPSFKLAFFDATYVGDGYGQLIYEPYWQGSGGASTTPTKNDWVTSMIDLDTGYFWNSGMFGIGSSAGGPPLRTLSEWLTEFNATDSNGFSNANLVGISVGLGSSNPDEIGYFDDVRVSGTSADATYDFEKTTPIPLPAAGWLLLAGLGGLGLAGRRKRKAA